MDQLGYRDRNLPYGVGVGATGSVAAFMNAVYAWMCVGLGLTGVVALLVANAHVVLTGGALLILFLAELGLVFVISGMINRLSAAAATGLFLLYAALNGVTLSMIFLVYANATIASAFIVTAGMFGATSLFGYVTKKDLSRLGGICFMALIGIILASVVNMFMANTTLYWLITYAGVAVFVGLTAYDTQKIKAIAYQTQGDQNTASKLAIVGSLVLYLDFINLFLFMLRIMGDRRR